MKITPLEIRQHEFEKTFRGYNIEEVDNFLANLSQEWERILNESKMLRMQLEMAEKEANKLREIEMTLFKTLKTAEDTSTMITEQANQQADKNIQEAKQKSQEILQSAQTEAETIVYEAQSRARYIKEEVLGEVKLIEKDFKDMYQHKSELLIQLRNLSTATLEQVHRFEAKFDKENIADKIKEAFDIFSDKSTGFAEVKEVLPETVAGEPTEATVQESELEYNRSESDTAEANVEVSENKTVSEGDSSDREKIEDTDKDRSDELGIIEGIGPKIAMLLYDAGIFTFKDLAITPVARIREILENAGSAYMMHDPSTWVEQALLAAEGRFEELEEMKDLLVGGKAEEDVEEKGIDNTTAFIETVEEKQEENIAAETVRTVDNNIEAITEEMLEKVNKVKAAIKKAMVEKDEKPTKDTTPLPILKDIVGKNDNSEGGSFFDNI